MKSMKIDWSGRSHKYTKEDIKYIVNIIQNADPLTQGQYLKNLRMIFPNTLTKKRICDELSSRSLRNYRCFIKN